jgi:hypothetical protein
MPKESRKKESTLSRETEPSARVQLKLGIMREGGETSGRPADGGEGEGVIRRKREI